MKGVKYLFDTDAITNILKPRPSPELARRLESIAKSQLFLSAITVGEIVYGALKSAKPRYHIDNLEHILLPSMNILTFDTAAAYHYGRLRAIQEKKGKPLSCADLQTASIAIANDLVLVTGNLRQFQMIDELHVENWIQ